VVSYYEPDVLLLDSQSQGAFFEEAMNFKIVKIFDGDPWSTLLVRSPDVLKNPRALSVRR
jgi:hypothetical protein